MELVLRNVTKSFGGLRAVSDVTLSVRDNVIFGLIGPNGAGKTTVFNLITGVYKPDRGTITFGATDLGPLRPAQIAKAGIGRTFQNIRLFGQLTVLENLLVACEREKKAHLAAAVLRLRSHYEDERAMRERAYELLRVFDLHKMADERPTSLSYGDQRRLEIARAMMLRPKLLLLDEPAAGMNYGEADGLKTQVRWLRDTFDLSVVLVEHNMQVVMGVCEELHVLDHGETIASGAPEAIRADPKVIAAYLGEDEESAASVQAIASSPDVAAALTPTPIPPEQLEALSRELTRKLSRALSAPDEAESQPDLPPPASEPKIEAPPPAAPAPAPKASSSRIRLSNVDAGWSSDEIPVAKPPPPLAVEPSTPDLSKLDTGWGSPDDDEKDGR